MWFGAFVGFLVIVFLGLWFPIIAQLTGGLVAGVIAEGGAGRGALAGFLAGILGARAEKTPCGKPDCEIRICVKNKGLRTCAECIDYANCSKLDFLKPHHKTLISDLDLIKKKGIDHYVNEIVANFRLDPIIID